MYIFYYIQPSSLYQIKLYNWRKSRELSTLCRNNIIVLCDQMPVGSEYERHT